MQGNNNDETTGCVIGVIVIVIIIFIIIGIGNSVKNDTKARNQREVNEFNKQMQQDPSTWNKEQRDRYNDFIEWDIQNERK